MLLLKNGTVFDGSGAEPTRVDVLIDGNRIARIGPGNGAPADCKVLDCSNLAVAPGFIDLHSHADLQVLQEQRTEKSHQGVTTEVVGNCGFSPYPQGGHAQDLCDFGGGILGQRDHWGWASAKEYLESVATLGKNVRVAPLVGHGSLRVAVAGLDQRPLADAEQDRMEGLLADSLDSGCVGFSTGLMYAPGSSADKREMEPLCRIAAAKGKLYATHMRSYAQGLVEATREQLDLARATGCRLQISHLQAAGRANWDLQRRALDEIEAARAEGIDVEFDIYPYQCGSTVLTQWLPQTTLDGGMDALMARLRDKSTRKTIADETERSRAQEWSDLTISGVASEGNRPLIGKTIADVAALRGCAGVDAMLDLLIEEHAEVNVICFNQSEDEFAGAAIASALLGDQRWLLCDRQTPSEAAWHVSRTAGARDAGAALAYAAARRFTRSQASPRRGWDSLTAGCCARAMLATSPFSIRTASRAPRLTKRRIFRRRESCSC